MDEIWQISFEYFYRPIQEKFKTLIKVKSIVKFLTEHVIMIPELKIKFQARDLHGLKVKEVWALLLI